MPGRVLRDSHVGSSAVFLIPLYDGVTRQRRGGNLPTWPLEELELNTGNLVSESRLLNTT